MAWVYILRARVVGIISAARKTSIAASPNTSGARSTPRRFGQPLARVVAKEMPDIVVGESVPRTIANAATKSGRDDNGFTVERMTEEQFQTLKTFLWN